MKALIFGINGQDGKYLKEILQSKSIEVIGVARSNGNWISGNISDFAFVSKLINDYKPDYVFHLAANSSTSHEFLFENHETISTGTLNILESVKKYAPQARVFITGSGVQFKNNSLPIKETDEFEASSPYSISRIQSVYAARYYRNLGLKTFVGYLFHHESPYRKDHHISKLTTNFIKGISLDTNHKLKLGDIEVKKEWAFAKDIAEGIFTLVNQDKVFEATIGTGKIHSIKDWLISCFQLKDLKWQDYIECTDNNFKPEYKILQSNPETILSLGWKPKTNLEQLAQIMME